MKRSIAILLVMLFSASWAFAEDDARTKQDKRFEAEHSFKFSKIINAFKKAKFFSQGKISMGYNYQFKDKGHTHNLDLNIETRTFKFYKKTCLTAKYNFEADPKNTKLRKKYMRCLERGSSLLVVPITMRVRANLNNIKNKDIRPADIKAGLARFVIKPEGITSQILSYIFKSEDYGIAQIHQIQLADFTYVAAMDLSRNKTFELVFKIHVGIGIGIGKLKRDKEFLARTLSHTHYDPKEWSASLALVTKGSIGIRIHKRVLIELFGGVDLYHTLETHLDDYEDETTVNYLTPFVGGGVRVKLTKWLYLNASAKQKYYMYHIYNNGLKSSTTSATEATLNLGVKW